MRPNQSHLLAVGFTLLVLLSIGESSQAQNVTCDNYLVEIFNNIIAYSKIDPTIAPFLLNTGKDLNDYGYYLNCKADPKMRYVTMRVALPLATVRLGLCGPVICGEKEYTEALKSKREELNEFVNKTFKVDISDVKVIFDDPAILKDNKTTATYIAFGVWELSSLSF